MIIEVNQNEIQTVVDILNESYRGGQGWTTEKGLVEGDRASVEMITSEINSGYCYHLYQHQGDYLGCFNLIKKDKIIEIGGLGIRHKYQGMGYGKLLLNEAEIIATSDSDIEELIVSVLQPRIELIRFYEKQGYSLTGITYPFPTHRGVGVPLVENLRIVVLKKSVLDICSPPLEQ